MPDQPEPTITSHRFDPGDHVSIEDGHLCHDCGQPIERHARPEPTSGQQTASSSVKLDPIDTLTGKLMEARAALERSEQANVELGAALRRHAVFTPNASTRVCLECDERGSRQAVEVHKPGCLAAESSQAQSNAELRAEVERWQLESASHENVKESLRAEIERQSRQQIEVCGPMIVRQGQRIGELEAALTEAKRALNEAQQANAELRAKFERLEALGPWPSLIGNYYQALGERDAAERERDEARQEVERLSRRSQPKSLSYDSQPYRPGLCGRPRGTCECSLRHEWSGQAQRGQG